MTDDIQGFKRSIKELTGDDKKARLSEVFNEINKNIKEIAKKMNLLDIKKKLKTKTKLETEDKKNVFRLYFPNFAKLIDLFSDLYKSIFVFTTLNPDSDLLLESGLISRAKEPKKTKELENIKENIKNIIDLNGIYSKIINQEPTDSIIDLFVEFLKSLIKLNEFFEAISIKIPPLSITKAYSNISDEWEKIKIEYKRSDKKTLLEDNIFNDYFSKISTFCDEIKKDSTMNSEDVKNLRIYLKERASVDFASRNFCFKSDNSYNQAIKIFEKLYLSERSISKFLSLIKDKRNFLEINSDEMLKKAGICVEKIENEQRTFWKYFPKINIAKTYHFKKYFHSFSNKNKTPAENNLKSSTDKSLSQNLKSWNETQSKYSFSDSSPKSPDLSHILDQKLGKIFSVNISRIEKQIEFSDFDSKDDYDKFKKYFTDLRSLLPPKQLLTIWKKENELFEACKDLCRFYNFNDINLIPRYYENIKNLIKDSKIILYSDDSSDEEESDDSKINDQNFPKIKKKILRKIMGKKDRSKKTYFEIYIKKIIISLIANKGWEEIKLPKFKNTSNQFSLTRKSKDKFDTIQTRLKHIIYFQKKSGEKKDDKSEIVYDRYVLFLLKKNIFKGKYSDNSKNQKPEAFYGFCMKLSQKEKNTILLIKPLTFSSIIWKRIEKVFIFGNGKMIKENIYCILMILPLQFMVQIFIYNR
ncbi:MAG: hypothetical protein ACTSW3_05275 [Promethearchaeota archaeon]